MTLYTVILLFNFFQSNNRNMCDFFCCYHITSSEKVKQFITYLILVFWYLITSQI